MSLRFQADNDLKFAIVKAVRRQEPSIDFASAQEAGLDGLGDPELLDRAAAEGRVLVSHDRRTMLNHFRNHLLRHSPEMIRVCSPELTRRPGRAGDDNALPTYGLRTKVQRMEWATLTEHKWGISGERRGHLAAGKSSPGLLVVAQGTAIGVAADAIVAMWALTKPGELTNQAYHLPSLINHSFPR
ncbi:MAG: hypothetical protein EXQ57_05405 [Bryobacterales bacterium]|nr:hypothetical protein [Bryobacterales bacterium]